MSKTTEKTATEKPAIKVTPLYAAFLKAFNAEDKAINKTSATIDAIEKTGLTVSGFFTALWSENYKVPKNWPLNAKGLPLSPTSKDTRTAIPAINRLVSALDMRKSRAKKAEKKAAAEQQLDEITGNVPVTVVPATEAPETTTATPASDQPESAPRVETSDKDLSFDAVSLIESLQGFMIAVSSGDLELDDKDAKLAHKLSKQLIELAQKA